MSGKHCFSHARKQSTTSRFLLIPTIAHRVIFAVALLRRAQEERGAARPLDPAVGRALPPAQHAHVLGAASVDVGVGRPGGGLVAGVVA